MHTQNTYAEGHAIMVNKPERAHLGEGAPETVCEMNSSLCPEVTTANQRLFVAAPVILAVLEEFVEDIETSYQHGDEFPDGDALEMLRVEWPDLAITYEKAVKAIALAKGGK